MQSTIVRPKVTGSPEVKRCEDCGAAAAAARRLGQGQDIQYLAITRRADRDVCGLHAEMHDQEAEELAAAEVDAFEDDLLALVEATVWADDPWAPALDEIDEIWYGAVVS